MGKPRREDSELERRIKAGKRQQGSTDESDATDSGTEDEE
jgi:hypothetical protein